MASTLQAWYAKIFEKPAPKGLFRHLAYQLAGVVTFTGYISFEVWLFDKVRPAGGRGLIFLLTFVFAVLFWWGSAYFILYRQVPLKRLFPTGWRPEPALPLSGWSLRFSSPNRSPRGRRATGPQASSWR